MVDSSTQHLPPLPKLYRNAQTQTGPMTHTLTLSQLEKVAEKAQQFLTSSSSLRSTMYRELGNRLKMPNSMEAHMAVKVEFPGIPASGWKSLFPKLEWHLSPDGLTEVGVTLSPQVLNQALSMERIHAQAIGCCKLALPATALVGKSVLAFMPPFQVWCQTDAAESGSLQSILTAYLVILDESGELRTPPNHTYSDSEETLIQEVLRANLERMRGQEMPLSPTFLRLLGHHQEADEVQEAIEEKMEAITARKRRREVPATSAPAGEEAQAVEEATPQAVAEAATTMEMPREEE